MSKWEYLEKDLIDFRNVVSRIRNQLSVYQSELNVLFGEISTLSYSESSEKMDTLFSIQNEIAISFYKYEFPLSDGLEKFMRDFDRDDEYSRTYLYEKILDGYKI